MHHLIFANQENLSQQGLDAMATELKLDVSRLHADMQAPETADRIARDRKLADELMVIGTPTIYINGRQFDGSQDMNEWLNLELATMSKNPAPVAAPSASSDAGTKTDGGKASAPAPSAPKK
jgi:hypothetical protein